VRKHEKQIFIEIILFPECLEPVFSDQRRRRRCRPVGDDLHRRSSVRGGAQQHPAGRIQGKVGYKSLFLCS